MKSVRIAGLCLAAALGLQVKAASAFNRYLEQPGDAAAESAPAFRYANMTNAEVFRELDQRGIPYTRERAAVPGVRAPIRLAGPVRGVLIRSTLPEEDWAETIYNILDARLALALDDFCRVLRVHDIVEVVHFTMYRSPKASGDEQFRHPGGLAIDVGALKKANGEWLSVGPHWPSDIGSKTCGGGAKKLLQRRGRELMSIACEVYDQRIFHYTLSPHYDADHADHWHLEIKPGVKWFLVN
jgi:hypothetical protein